MSEDPTEEQPSGSRLAPRSLLGDTYEIERALASGGMAEVYRARNIHTDEPVAVKVVLPAFAGDPTIVALFKKEATILSRLHHEAIVNYYHFTVDRESHLPYLVMEFVDGVPLNKRLADSPLGQEDVRGLLVRLASGLAAAHEAGVVHRDLSPDNVILPHGAVDEAKIIDFGIAKAAAIGGGTLVGDNWAGKYNYMSPEQLGLNGGEVTERSDIYSLGLIAAAAVLGRPLDMAGPLASVLEKRRSVPDLSGVDERLRPVIAHMLEPRPEARPATMRDVVAALRAPTPADRETGTVLVRPPRSATTEDTWSAPTVPQPTGAGRATMATSVGPAAETDQDDSPFGPPPGGTTVRPVPSPPEPAEASKSGDSRRRRGGLGALVAGLGVVVLLAGGFWAYQQGLLSPQPPASPDSPVVAGVGAQGANDAASPPSAPEPGKSDQQAVPPTAGAGVGQTPIEPSIPAETGADKAVEPGTTASADEPTADELPETPPPTTPTTGASGAIEAEGATGAPPSPPTAPPALETEVTSAQGTAEATKPPEAEQAVIEQPQPPAQATVDAQEKTADVGGNETSVGGLPQGPGSSGDSVPQPAIATEADWIRAYPFSVCETAIATTAADNSLRIRALGPRIETFDKLVEDFIRDRKFDPTIVLGQVDPAQCPAVDFLRYADSVGVAGPDLRLVPDVVASGEKSTGMVTGTDGRRLQVLVVDNQGMTRAVATQQVGDGASFEVSQSANVKPWAPMLAMVLSSEDGFPAADASAPQAAATLFPALADQLRAAGSSASVAWLFFKVVPRQ